VSARPPRLRRLRAFTTFTPGIQCILFAIGYLTATPGAFRVYTDLGMVPSFTPSCFQWFKSQHQFLSFQPRMRPFGFTFVMFNLSLRPLARFREPNEVPLRICARDLGFLLPPASKQIRSIQKTIDRHVVKAHILSTMSSGYLMEGQH
jgi:hypothetical protein